MGKKKNKKSFHSCSDAPLSNIRGCEESDHYCMNKSIRSLIETARGNQYMSLDDIKITLVDTGEEFTLRQLDQLLSN